VFKPGVDWKGIILHVFSFKHQTVVDEHLIFVSKWDVKMPEKSMTGNGS